MVVNLLLFVNSHNKSATKAKAGTFSSSACNEEGDDGFKKNKKSSLGRRLRRTDINMDQQCSSKEHDLKLENAQGSNADGVSRSDGVNIQYASKKRTPAGNMDSDSNLHEHSEINNHGSTSSSASTNISKLQRLTSSFRRRPRRKHSNNPSLQIHHHMTKEEASKLQFSYLSEVSLFHSMSTSFIDPSSLPSSLSHSSCCDNHECTTGTQKSTTLSSSSGLTSQSSPSPPPSLVSPSSINVTSKRRLNNNHHLEYLWLRLPDDPTVEESFECVFSHQLVNNHYHCRNKCSIHDKHDKNTDDNNNNDYDNYDDYGDYDLASGLGSGSGSLLASISGSSSSDSLFECKSAKIVPVGTYSPFLYLDRNINSQDNNNNHHHNHICNNNVNTITKPKRTNCVSDSRRIKTVKSINRSSSDHETTSTKNSNKLLSTTSHSMKINQKDNVNNFTSSNNTTTTSTNETLFLCHACQNGTNDSPTLPPNLWPQCPLLLRPTPGSGTRVKGVRFVKDNLEKQYLMDTSSLAQQHYWWDALHKLWKLDSGTGTTSTIQNHNTTLSSIGNRSFCCECCILPINNGNEKNGETLVIDFESNLFEGSLQLRIRNSNGTTKSPYNDSIGFFSGKHRQYQCVISGRFKKEGIPMTECISGQIFSHPVKTPAPYITKGAIKLISFFAPRLQTKLHGDNQMVITPLGSTPQSIQVDEARLGRSGSGSVENFKAVETLIKEQEEPLSNSRRLIGISCKSATSSSMTRAKARKKAFDKLCGSGDKTHTFQTDKIYTFEFLQHLVNFDDLEMNLGSMLGKYKLSHILNNQPLSIMAAHQHPSSSGGESSKDASKITKFEKFWSFDLWHKSIVSKTR